MSLKNDVKKDEYKSSEVCDDEVYLGEVVFNFENPPKEIKIKAYRWNKNDNEVAHYKLVKIEKKE